MQTNEILDRSEWFLAPGVHILVTDSMAIFIDITKDFCYGAASDQARALSKVVKGWPNMDGADSVSLKDSFDVAHALAAQGILTRDPAVGKIASIPTLNYADAALVYRHERQMPDIRFNHLYRFVYALSSATLLLKCRSLNYALAYIKRRRTLHSHEEFDIDHARNIVRLFYWIRPFFYAKQFEYSRNATRKLGRCLFDSLVLLEFLSWYRLYPSWVIGVIPNPFKAHSWVQYDHFVLNGTPNYVESYEPIIVV